MATLVAELAYDEHGGANKWLVPSERYPGYFTVVARRGDALVCSCPAGVENAREVGRWRQPTWCRHVRAVARLEQERVA